MVVWPWVMPYPAVDFGVWVPSAFGPEFPYRPMGTMFVVEELDEGVGRVAVGSLGEGRGGTRGCDDYR